MKTNDIPAYGNKKMWNSLSGISENAIQCILENIKAIRNEEEIKQDESVLEFIEICYTTPFNPNLFKLYCNRFYYLSQMLDTSSTEVKKIFPYLLAAYFINFSSKIASSS